MARRKMPETLDELSAERDRSEKQLHYWEDQEMILKHQVTTLTQKERTDSVSGLVCWNRSWNSWNS